jgi:hypothetical protein
VEDQTNQKPINLPSQLNTSTSKRVEVIRAEIKNDIFALLDKLDGEQLQKIYTDVIPVIFRILYEKYEKQDQQLIYALREFRNCGLSSSLRILQEGTKSEHI